MTSDTWPEGPPEIPPPWRPDQPPAEPYPPRQPVPLVPASHEDPSDALAHLLRRRIVLVTGALTAEVATDAAAQLMTLDADDDAGIELHLHCPDGDFDAALMLADTVELTAATITAVCRGALGGVALAPFVVAERRLCHPHAIFRMREPRISICGRSREVAAQAAALRQQLDRFTKLLADATAQPPGRVAADIANGVVLTAEDALDYGLVHDIASR